MKTPISYYGGKQTMASMILKLFPPHKLYCEPFFGGGAVFFAKEPSPVEVINDKDLRVIKFYKVCKTHFGYLKALIDRTPHSRKLHLDAQHVLKHPELYSDIKQAWAFWVQTNMSFGSCIFGGFAYGRKKNSSEKKMRNKRAAFTDEYQKRLELVQIECEDALKVIESRDSVDSFHYCDPPYFNAVMGHYGGYTRENFEDLLKTLAKVKGKFLMSSYPSELLDEYIKKYNWKKLEVELNLCMATKAPRKKIEVLTANYEIGELLK